MSRASVCCRPTLWAALLLPVALSACGDESSSDRPRSASQTPTDACALLTAAEVEAATGIAPGQPVDESRGQIPMCNWPTADGSDIAFLNVLIGPSQKYRSYDEAMEKWAASAANMDFPFEADNYQEVEGVGDVGVWISDAGMLQAHSGGTMVQIMTNVAEGRDQLEATRALASQALARIE